MKKIFLITMFFFSAIALFAQDTENKMITFLLKPKVGTAFEQKMTAFAKANFKGNMDFRVQQVFGGKNDGMFIMSGSKLTNMAYYDSEQYSKESQPFWAAFEKEIRPLLDEMHLEFLTYQKEYSTAAQQAFASKNVVTERYVKVGRMTEYQALELEAKPVWEKSGQNLAVYRNVTGNVNRVVSVRRLTKGWSDLDPGNNPTFKETFIKVYSEPRYNEFIKAINDCTESTNAQFQYYRADLSNK
mgnify:FL=1|jgi:hypothetical protein